MLNVFKLTGALATSRRHPDRGLASGLQGLLVLADRPRQPGRRRQPQALSTPYPVTVGNYADASLGTDPAFQSAWVNETTYQIICAGQDRQFGPGGWYDSFAKTSTKVPFAPKANQGITGVLLGKDARFVERDNISNFAGGPLD